MSGGVDSMQLRAEDVFRMLVSQVHIGGSNCDFQMEQYVWKRKNDGIHIINIKKTWEKLLLAARAIAAIENPADVFVISARPYGQRAVLKFAAHTGATPSAGRFTPGTFTNQIQTAYREPRLLIVTDPRTDHQAITEASYVNLPVIALCNTDSPMKLVDIAIPCNNKGSKACGLMWWMLAREVLILRGQTSRSLTEGQPKFILDGKDVMVDLYFYRDPEEQEKEQEVPEKGGKDQEPLQDWGQELSAPPMDQWAIPGAPTELGSFATGPMDWAKETEMHGQTQQWAGAPTAPLGVIQPQPQQPKVDEWGGGGAANW